MAYIPNEWKDQVVQRPKTYQMNNNDDGSVNVMNAAWGTMLERNQVILNLTETHKTVENIRIARNFFIKITSLYVLKFVLRACHTFCP